MKKSYISPVVLFESLQLRENIADRCWKYASNKKGVDIYFYFDDPKLDGDECKIIINGESCGGAKIQNFSSLSQAAKDALQGGNSGEPFHHTSYMGSAS